MATARAVLEIVTDASGVDAGLNKVRGATASLKSDLSGLAGTMGLAFGGAAVVSGLKTLVTNTFAYAENISDLSTKMGVSVEAAQRWKFAVEQSGGSIETVDKAVNKLSVNLAGGSTSVQKALQSAGLEFDKIRQMKPEDAFNGSVAAIEKIPDPMTQARVATELFGKAGLELLPAIRNGMADVAAEAPVMSAATIKALDDAKDAWSRLGNAVTIVTGQMIGQMMSLATEATNSAKSFFGFLEIALKQGPGAALSLAGAMGEVRAANEQAAQSQNTLTTATAGTTRAVRELTPEEERASKEAERLAKAFQANVDVLTGKALAREIATLAKEVAAAEKQGGLSAYQYEQLGKRLNEIHAKGGTLPPRLNAIWLEHERLNPSIKVTAGAYQDLSSILSNMPALPAMLPPPPLPLPVSWTSADWSKVLNLGAIPPLAAPPAREFGKSFGAELSGALSELPSIILGAVQGGGSVGGAALSFLGGQLFGPGSSLNTLLNNGLSSLATRVGGGFMATLAQGLSAAIPGLGALIGPALGSLLGKVGGFIGGLFGGNDTKKMREQFAQQMGLSLDGLYNKLRQYGAEGDVLVNQALNVIGKGDKAAQQRWFEAVDALLAKQKQAAADAAQAVEDGAEREREAIETVRDAYQEKIDDIQTQMDSLSASIAQEAPEEIMGVIEAQERAALAQLEIQKKALEDERDAAILMAESGLDEASTKAIETATRTRDAIEEIFRNPMPIRFDLSGLPGQSTSGGGPSGSAGSGIQAPSTLRLPSLVNSAFLSSLSRSLQASSGRPIVIQNDLKLDGRSLWRNQRQYATEALERG